jgi:membrane fusion protein (multidrug efflux system)
MCLAIDAKNRLPLRRGVQQSSHDVPQNKRTSNHYWLTLIGSTMRKKLLAVVAVALAASVSGSVAYWVTWSRHFEKTDNAYVKADNIVISPKINGYVAQVLVKDHQRVVTGQALARVEPSDYEAKVEQQQAVLRSHQAALRALDRQKALQRAQIAQAEATMNAATAQAAKAALDYRRDEELFAKGYATRDRTDTSHLASEVATAVAARARAELAAAREQLSVTYAREEQLKADVQHSVAAAKAVQLDLDHATLLAPSAGVIGNRTVEVGQYVRAGSQLMTVVPADQIYVIANFKETQIHALRPGQHAIVVVDALPGVELDGIIESLAPATGSEFSLLPPENAVGNFTKIVQRVPVKIAISKHDARASDVRPGMSVAVTVDTRIKERPASLVQRDTDERPR